MQRGFYFDQARCTGCFACSVACKDLHSTPAGPANWMQIKYREAGSFPNLFVSHQAVPCYHCANPVCSFVCPDDAITKREEDGVVVVDRDKCRGAEPCGIIGVASMGGGYTYGESIAPCQAACPAGLHAPAYIALIAKGKNREALELIRRHMPLPSVCGRICVAPCETACTRSELDEPVAIMALKRFAHDSTPYEAPERVTQTEDQKVAVIGSGPAGLGAAYDLIKMGYGVTVFEALPVLGGMLAVGAPTYRVSREALQKDLDYIEALGVEFKTNTAVDLGQGLDDLLADGYGAVLLAVGAHRGTKLNVPGADLAGSMVGTTFLKHVNLGKPVEVGNEVVVIGDGNTALDCARTARRLGAETVRLMFRKGSFEEAAGHEDEKRQAREEGVLFEPGQSLTRVLGERGRVTGVEAVTVTGPAFDENGRRRYRTVEGMGKTTSAETVIFAIGQTPDLAGLPADGEVKQDEQGTIGTDPETMMTGRPGIFSAGDSFDLAGSVVHAIASGQRAALFMNRFLQGDVLRVRPKTVVQASDIVVNIPAGSPKQPRQAERMRPVAERLSSWGEVVLGFDADAAVAEARRCLNCAGHLCKDACAYSSPQFDIEAEAKMQKCDLCYDRWENGRKPICVEACPPRALDAGTMEELTARYGSSSNAVGFVYSPVQQPSILSKRKKRPAGSPQ
jgi:NADPH-dependent glutamate synthase beta subunit-like oxidoreductase/Pyruvate/2-oxoacid:ferredoxin oxidoreductase delta subunit